MPGHAKPTPREAFQANMADAHHLVLLAECLTNTRTRGMRSELRQRVGDAWKVPARQRHKLDCVESADVYLVFKPDSRLGRSDLDDHRPLLRQALVAACAATETFLADIAMTKMAALTASEQAATKRLKDVQMTVGDWLHLEQRYKYRRRGLHEKVIRRYVEEFASTDPSKMGALFSLLGVTNWTAKMDKFREIAGGDSFAFLDRIAKRRNRIVHTGDRQGLGRASLTVDEVKDDLAALESVVASIEKMLE